MTIILTKLL